MLSNENFTVRPLPTLVFNRGASQQLSNQIQALGKSAALIVTDKNLAASGVLEPVLEALRASNLRVDVFDGVEPNPTDKNVEAGALKLRELGDACVVPIGGGSSMDCGKSVALLAANDMVHALDWGQYAQSKDRRGLSGRRRPRRGTIRHLRKRAA